MGIRIGTAPDSWGVWLADGWPSYVPWDRFLDEVAASGYDAIELGPYGYLPTEEGVLRQELERRGLSLIAATIMGGHLEDPDSWPAIETALTRAGDLLASLGGEYLVLWDDTYFDLKTGKHVLPAQLDGAGWERLIEATHRSATLARDRFGLRFAFHPHCDTHVETEEQIELLLEQTDPELVSLCLDTGHHAYAAGDPVQFMSKHHERIIYLHLKDVDGEKLKRVKAENIPMVQACQMGVFVEQTEGVVDFEALGGVLRDVGFEGMAAVEQGFFKPDHDSLKPIGERTLAYFRNLGIG